MSYIFASKIAKDCDNAEHLCYCYFGHSLYGTEGLYALPEATRLMTKMPYMEFTVGLENILKFIRIDYVRRLSYTDGFPEAQKNGVKLTFRFTL